MKKFWINLSGQSMSPLIQDGDEVLIIEKKLAELSCGDIVLFFDSLTRELTLHRLVDHSIETKGDFSLQKESNSPHSVMGLAIAFKRDSRCYWLPRSNSLMNRFFLSASKMRLKGYFIRKAGIIILSILARYFEFYCDKTTIHHTEELMLNGL